MKIKDLYEMKTVATSKEIGELKGHSYDHIPEIENHFGNGLYGLDNEKIEIKTIIYKSLDGRRSWELRTVWFEEKPVMVIQNGGREGDDHYERFVSDNETFLAMVNYIRSLIKDENEVNPIVYSEDYDGDDLISFYGHNLHEFLSL